MLDTNSFSFSHSVFKMLLLETCKNQGLFGKGLESLSSRVVKSRDSLVKGKRHLQTTNLLLLRLLKWRSPAIGNQSIENAGVAFVKGAD